MRKILYSVLCLLSLSLCAEELPEGFYNSANGLKDCELKGTLKELIRDHTAIPYGNGTNSSWEVFYYADQDENGYCMDMYCDTWYKFTSPGVVVSGCNVEHSFAKSWWGGATNDAYKDCYHLNPSNSTANSSRSNYPLGVPVKDFKDQSKTGSLKVGKIHHDSLNVDFYVFEPKDEYKGDFARAYFYMATCYGKDKYGAYDPTVCSAYQGWRLDNSDVGSKFAMQNDNYLEFQPWEQEVLIQWHRQDPVSVKEIKRADAVSNFQHNRNPFIDYPYLAEYIWGEKAGEELNMADLMGSWEDEFIPGESNGWRGGGTPVVPKPKFGVTWFACDEEIQVDSITENKKITALPATPESCSTISDVFMGWTDQPINGTMDEAPEVLYTKPADFPTVIDNVSYYAVFAKKTTEEGAEPATYTYDTNHPSSDWTNTGVAKSGYWLLDSGHTLVSPEINLAGLSSITVTIRTFGGKSYNILNISAGDQSLGTITTDKGTTLTEFTWTNTQTLNGRASIVFSSNYGSGQGIGISSAIINATGMTVSYSDYLTSCSATQNLTNHKSSIINHKLIINGHLYIQSGTRLYTPTGQRVQ